MKELDVFDLSGIDPKVIEETGSELEAFQKLSLDAVYNRFGVVMFQVLTRGTYDPKVMMKATFSRQTTQGLRQAKQVLASKLCDSKIDKAEETLTLAYIVAVTNKELGWPKSAMLLFGILIVRRFGKKLLSWICSGNVDDFLDRKTYI